MLVRCGKELTHLECNRKKSAVASRCSITVSVFREFPVPLKGSIHHQLIHCRWIFRLQKNFLEVTNLQSQICKSSTLLHGLSTKQCRAFKYVRRQPAEPKHRPRLMLRDIRVVLHLRLLLSLLLHRLLNLLYARGTNVCASVYLMRGE